MIWLGQTCNFRCQFCYFMDRIKNASHPEHAFMPIEKAKKICSGLVGFYHNNAVDIQGGEPTIYPAIHGLVAHCRTIGLLPTLITNAVVLAQRENCERLRDAGIRDLLISVHGLGDEFDKLVGMPGAHAKQMRALEVLREVGIPFRFNCVLSKVALPDLPRIAQLAVDSQARVVNFIAFNPFEDQAKGKRSQENVPRYSEVIEPLTAALDLLENAGVECNVRYYPFCMIDERHRKSIYNFQQLPYDIHEWDYASWSWSGLQQQRMSEGDTSPYVTLQEATIDSASVAGAVAPLIVRVRDALAPFPRVQQIAANSYRFMNALVGKTALLLGRSEDPDRLYRNNARMRSSIHCNYQYSPKCTGCSLRNICDGFHGDYAVIFGSDEACPVKLKQAITDPKHYIANQLKVVEAEDYGWAC